MKSLLYFSRLYIEFFFRSFLSSLHHFSTFSFWHFSFFILQLAEFCCNLFCDRKRVCECDRVRVLCFFRNASFDILKYWNWWTAIIDGMGDCTKEDSWKICMPMTPNATYTHVYVYTETQTPPHIDAHMRSIRSISKCIWLHVIYQRSSVLRNFNRFQKWRQRIRGRP